jgi:hypothetical protein
MHYQLQKKGQNRALLARSGSPNFVNEANGPLSNERMELRAQLQKSNTNVVVWKFNATVAATEFRN